MTANYTRDANIYNEEIQRQQRAQWQPLDAEYYNFTGDDGRLNAGLIVLLDGEGHAQRAELRYYNPLPIQVQNAILRQAQTLLAERYLGVDRTTPLYVVEGNIAQAPVEVLHTMVPPPPAENSYQLWPVLLGLLALLALVMLVWVFSNWMRGGSTVAEVPATEAAPAAAAMQAAPSQATPLAASAAANAAPPGMQTNNLAPSTMANPELDVGSRAQIRPQLQSFVRTLPGPDQGEPVGYLQNATTVTIIGGPVWLPGESDTIVWWYVELPDGTSGWTPANTSTLTLLDPAP
jgi:hypothetical protein